MSNATVSRLLALLSLPDAIRQQVDAGKVSASAAYELAHVKDAGRQAELAGQLASGGLTRDALSGGVKKERRVSNQPPIAGHPARVTAALGGGRAVTISGPDLTLESFISLLEQLLTKARKARTQGLELPTVIKMLKDQAKQS